MTKANQRWQIFEAHEDCPHCGGVARFLTTAQESVYDGDDGHCTTCGCPATVSCDEEAARVVWHDEPDCQCDWCMLARYSNNEADRYRARLTEAERQNEALADQVREAKATLLDQLAADMDNYANTVAVRVKIFAEHRAAEYRRRASTIRNAALWNQLWHKATEADNAE